MKRKHLDFSLFVYKPKWKKQNKAHDDLYAQAYAAIEAQFDHKITELKASRSAAELARALTNIQLQASKKYAREAIKILQKIVDLKPIN